ncbi:hypothetical protein BDV93DRAFT_508845 [Ceratobasidium sp. AG-I]|nr:hypothetical protein BDV93DRAFT_561264 [Ceratobasidium sp. AG-I]KAF8603100.1 hypothetical protein BDV93DRAFT_508845 [Ceratobasidium sp. AG-I]
MTRIDCTNFTDTDDKRCNVCLSTGHAIGLAFSAQGSLISLVSVLALGITVLYRYRQTHISPPPEGPRRVLRSNLDGYMLSLLVGEAVVSVGGLIDAKWAYEQQTYCGGTCTAQGILTLIGVTTTALSTLAITVHTWLSIYRSRPPTYSLPVWLGFTLAVWLFVILFAVLGWQLHSKDGSDDGLDFFTPTPFWCWISSRYRGERLGAEYVWVWLAGFGSILLYVPLFLFSRGNLVFREEASGRMRWEWHSGLPSAQNNEASQDKQAEAEQKALRSQAWKMLVYPAAYTFQVLGFSVVRWVTFSDPSLGKLQTPEMSSFAAASLFFRFIFRLGGFINAVLILTTRPNVLLIGSRSGLSPSDSQREQEESGSVDAKSEPSESQTVPVSQLPYTTSPRARPTSVRSNEIELEDRR